MAGGTGFTSERSGFEWQWLLAAVAVLTVLRMIPVAVSLIGVGFSRQTVPFIGWFGPRGLATVVFALLAVEELGSASPVMPDYLGVLTLTVLLSVFAHGFSAGPCPPAMPMGSERRPQPKPRTPLAPELVFERPWTPLTFLCLRQRLRLQESNSACVMVPASSSFFAEAI